jgi:hypothetical protein
MAGIRFNVKIQDNITPMLKRKQRLIDQIPQEAADFFRDETPIRSGNARRRTQLRGDSIEANYNYASRLDAGSSRQAPDGMTEPTVEFIDQRLKQIMKAP